VSLLAYIRDRFGRIKYLSLASHFYPFHRRLRVLSRRLIIAATLELKVWANGLPNAQSFNTGSCFLDLFLKLAVSSLIESDQPGDSQAQDVEFRRRQAVSWDK
jgi:hypothetical protein